MPQPPDQPESDQSVPAQREEKPRNIFPDAIGKPGRVPKIFDLMDYQPQAYERFLLFIERGAYDYIAAESLGITKETFARWMSKGRRTRKASRYRQFFLDVMQAKARARLLAEMEVRVSDPKFYLLNGPGRSEEGRPGWTQPVDNGRNEDMSQGVAFKEDASNADLAKTLEVLQDLGLVPEIEPGSEFYDPIFSQNTEPDTGSSPSNGQGEIIDATPKNGKGPKE